MAITGHERLAGSTSIPRRRPRRTEDSVNENTPKLTTEIIPTSLHGKSPREVKGRAWWDRHRRKAYAAAGHRCEICGGTGSRHPVEAHEVYEYDESARPPVQRVIRLIALCPACHAVKHLYRTHDVAVQRGDMTIYENALAHLAAVNGWNGEQVKVHLAETRATFERREELGSWVQDFSRLDEETQATPGRRQRGQDDKGDDDDPRFYWEIEQERYELGIDRDGFPILHPSFYETDAGADALYYQMLMERDD